MTLYYYWYKRTLAPVGFGFYTFLLFGHWFAIPTYSKYEITYDNFLSYLKISKNNIFRTIIELKRIEDIDFRFNELNE